MGWDTVLMVFVDLMLSRGGFDREFYVTRNDIVKLTNLCPTTVSNNLSVCVKNGYLRRVDFNTGGGREVRYYVASNELSFFIDKFLR